MHFSRQSVPAATRRQAYPAAPPASQVRAPLIGECHANFECKLVDSRLIRK
jgi:flavin reductase (DIM6/NTAB) family NADH-FMN oxidoreductase RutF